MGPCSDQRLLIGERDEGTTMTAPQATNPNHLARGFLMVPGQREASIVLSMVTLLCYTPHCVSVREGGRPGGGSGALE
jgi:hypothetical protein